MILGIGTDLANIERIEAVLARHGDRFKTRVFTEIEQRKAESRVRAVAATYAKRWAAKEASIRSTMALNDVASSSTSALVGSVETRRLRSPSAMT